jgi:hypothetical protein
MAKGMKEGAAEDVQYLQWHNLVNEKKGEQSSDTKRVSGSVQRE